MTTHACPPRGKSLTPCCRRSPFELPRDDRITLETRLVTCGRRFPTNRPGWLGDYQPWPCGRCGKDVDASERHECPDICTRCGTVHHG